jgi:hypothetical protein
VGLEDASGYCDPHESCDPAQRDAVARCHLWSEHDENRIYTDPAGWAAHVAGCATCRGADTDVRAEAIDELLADDLGQDGPEQTYPLSKAQFDQGCGFRFNGVDLCEDENGRWVYAYGARGKTVMARAVNQFDRDMSGMTFGGAPSGYGPGDVEHKWAVCVEDPDGPEGWFIKWSSIAADAPNAFQLTVVTR